MARFSIVENGRLIWCNRDKIAFICTQNNQMNNWWFLFNKIITFENSSFMVKIYSLHFAFLFSFSHEKITFSPPGFKFVNEMTERDVWVVVRTKHWEKEKPIAATRHVDRCNHQCRISNRRRFVMGIRHFTIEISKNEQHFLEFCWNILVLWFLCW